MRKLRYYKRHRMELDLRHPLPECLLPTGFRWLPWSPELLDCHARVKSACFAGETDAEVFPCLASPSGCRDLMAAIVNNNSFCPEATWLVADRDYCVGTVQGMLDENGYGAIQNLGVVSGFRGLGLGCALLLRALEGFAERGAKRAFLEVTAANTGAVKLYRRLGFRCYRTIYREVEIRVTDPESVRVGI